MVGLTGGAEAIVIPEFEVDPEKIAHELRLAYERGKAHALVVVAEGSTNNAEELAIFFRQQRERLGFELRVTILGHVQRGGTPTFADRLLATELAAGAVEQLAAGDAGVLVGRIESKIAATPLDEVVNRIKPLDEKLLHLARVLAR
jgi:6-phosphofructokinase 1